MRSAEVFVGGVAAGILEEVERGKRYVFRYLEEFQGQPVSLTRVVTAWRKALVKSCG